MTDWVVYGVAGFWLLTAGVCVFGFRALIVGSFPVGASFALAVAVGLAALLVPPPFDWAAEGLMAASGVPERLRAVDRGLEAIEELPRELWEKLKAPFASGSEEAAGAGGLPSAAPGAISPGPLEGALVPPLARLLALLLRGVALAASLGFMLLALAIGAATRALAELRSLRGRVHELEHAASPDA